MFPNQFFPLQYFPDHYWPGGETAAAVVVSDPTVRRGRSLDDFPYAPGPRYNWPPAAAPMNRVRKMPTIRRRR